MLSSPASRRFFRTLTVAALVPLMATSCAHYSPQHVAPAPRLKVQVPPDIRAAFEHLTAAPGKKGQPISQAEVFALVGNLRGSEVDKARAGMRLLQIVDAYNRNL